MTTKKRLIAFAAVLAVVSLACGINLTLPDDAIEIGETRTDQILVSAPPGGETASVRIEFGAGDLIIGPGATEGLITGTATYNVDGLKPTITASGGDVSITQESPEFKLGGLPNVNQVENSWELYFSNNPVDLEVRAGAFDGQFEFGAMAIQELDITSGASKTALSFAAPNLTNMGQFRFRTGASSADLTGLSNANFSLMKFEGGVGSYTLDFSGALSRDATVEIDAALSSVTLIVPENIPTTLNLESNLTNVSTKGTWAGGGNTFSLAGQGPTLTFIIKLGAGNLELETAP